MKYLNKFATAFCSAALGLLSLTSCEGGDLYSVGAPDWISAKVDSIKNLPSNDPQYSIGNPDFSTGWWSSFSKYYVIPAGEIFEWEFDLSINPSATNTYKNFALVLCSDAERGAKSYKEYGAIRYDNQPSGNSEWGDYIDRTKVTSNLTFETDTDTGIEKLGGRVKLTIDRTSGGLKVTMTNGTVTKVYDNSDPLPNLNSNAENTNIRCFICVEGSYIEVWNSNIEPFDENAEYQPKAMELNGVPGKVLLGKTFEEAFANVTATVEFEEGASKSVTFADLTFQTVPDMNSLGTKTLIAVYNKTYKGANANTPVIASKSFQVVDKMYTSVGASDNSSPFFGERSGLYKIAPNETFVSTFTSYNAGGVNNWENFLVVLSKQDLSLGADGEYAVLRADNYGWGNGYGTCTATCSHSDWDAWRAAMNGAKVTAYITNKGDGTADVNWVAIGSDGVTYTQSYTGITVSDPNDFNMSFTIEKSHIEFDNVIGAEDNSSAFFGARSDLIQVPAGKTYTRHFINYNAGGVNNWENFLVVLSKQDLTLGADGEYAVLRADNYGWGNGYETCTPTCSHSDWDAWRAAINGAAITLTVTNTGDGTANVSWIAIGSDGNTYTQSYTGITVSDPADMWMSFTIEKAHIVFE